MYLFMILCMFFLATQYDAARTKHKFCVNCKHFIPSDIKDEFGKCALYPIEDSKFFVDGKIRNDDFYSCSSARGWSHLCGKNATKYRKKYTRQNDKNNKKESKKDELPR